MLIETDVIDGTETISINCSPVKSIEIDVPIIRIPQGLKTSLPHNLHSQQWLIIKPVDISLRYSVMQLFSHNISAPQQFSTKMFPKYIQTDFFSGV